jgi:peptidoglycan/LPS O-acetylase OafA/YrhL
MSTPGLLGPVRLSDLRGRDNNCNLLRVLAAVLVVASHSYWMTGHEPEEPTLRLLGVGGGDLGVDIFFVLSGFLVAKSFASKSLAEFTWARAIRIYPGLWASVILTVLVAALFFAKLPAVDFLRSPDTLSYFAHNFTMLPKFGAQQGLVNVFPLEDHVFDSPLWTLPIELQMYMILALVGAALGIRARYVGALLVLGAASVLLSARGVHLLSFDRARFIYFFFAGSLAYTLRHRIVLTARIAGPLLAIVVAAPVFNAPPLARQAILALALPYLLLWCAYVPAGVIREWNRVGDYSYGIYIYAFPVQAALVSTGVAVTPWWNFAMTLLLVVPIAALSWHLIEHRALRIPMPRIRSPFGVRTPREVIKPSFM